MYLHVWYDRFLNNFILDSFTYKLNRLKLRASKSMGFPNPD